MAIDGQNLRGGAFPIYDTSRSVGTYTANLQKQAAQRAAEQKALQEDMDKIKIDGLRDADKEDYFKGFEDWRNTAQSAYKERDFRKKAQLQSESDRKYLELQSLVNKSKEYGRLHQDVSTKFLDNRFRDQFSDDAVARWQKTGKLPMSSAEFISDPSALERQLDFNKMNNEFVKINDYLKKNAVDSNQPLIENMTLAGDRGVKITPYAKVDPNIQAQKYAEIFDNDRDFKKLWMQQRPDLFDNPNLSYDQAKSTLISDLIKNNPLERRGSSTYKWEDKWKEKTLFNDALVRARKSIGENGVGMAQPITIPYGSGNNKGNVQLDEYIPISLSKKNFAGSEFIDLKTGKPGGKLKSSNDYEIVGVGNAPFITSGNFKGSISQPKFAKDNPNAIERKPIVHVQVPSTGDLPAKDFFVPYDRLPENVKSSKQVRDALVNFKPAKPNPNRNTQSNKASSKPTTRPKKDPLGLF